jgi:hypothetical protein
MSTDSVDLPAGFGGNVDHATALAENKAHIDGLVIPLLDAVVHDRVPHVHRTFAKVSCGLCLAGPNFLFILDEVCGFPAFLRISYDFTWMKGVDVAVLLPYPPTIQKSVMRGLCPLVSSRYRRGG